MKGWLWFAAVQLISLIAMLLGLLVLIPFCLAHAWKEAPSAFDPTRTIDVWSWKLFDRVFGNREDGCSGQKALIWNKEGTARVPYMPNANPAWRAYCWSALRNNCDNLKYVFAWKDGPFKQWIFLGRPQKIGWQMENGFNVPVISL